MVSVTPDAQSVKKCRFCGITKSLSEFNRKGPGRFQPHCRTCGIGRTDAELWPVVPCLRCGARVRSDSKSGICPTCRSFCECGKPKTQYAQLCASCAARINARRLWDNPELAEQARVALVNSGRARRRKPEEVRYEHFRQRKFDGRFTCTLTVEHGGIRMLYRYRWVWEQANGPIPKGMTIHHINGDASDDRLENLQLISLREHVRLHTLDEEWNGRRLATVGRVSLKTVTCVCQQCGTGFHPKQLTAPNIYCSLACYSEARKGLTPDQWRNRPR